MLFIRSLIFSILFYLSTALQMIFWTPVYFLVSRDRAWKIVKLWSKSNVWLLRVIVGTKFVVRGAENLPEGGYIMAPKHQSAWDTFALLPWMADPVYILKRELMWIPLFGWYVARMKMIPINRGDREKSVRAVNQGARYALDGGRQLLIYPEGTRRPPAAEPRYKSGIAHLYLALDAPVVPIAHNAGLFWPKNSFWRYPGEIIVDILPPIQPGLTRQDFMDELIRSIEDACDRQLLEHEAAAVKPPFPAQVKARIESLRNQKKT